ncbi:MAG TPA: Atxe2 family lasso peptide isopeptidase, partial [Sphingomicrobium sp.]|nr:Atxe2 family lasso peptide isopeptidase [Sphingomicrobium sp.]
QWYIVDLSSGRSKPISGAGEAIIRDPGILAEEPPIWSPDGHWIYYRALKENEVQLWRSAKDGSVTERLTEEAGDVEFVEAAFPEHGIRLAIGPARDAIDRAEQAESDQGILVDEHVDLAQNLYRGANINGRRRSQRLTGKWFGRTGILGNRTLGHRILSFKSHRLLQSVAGREDVPADGSVARSERGDAATIERKDGRSYIRVDHPSGVTRYCEPSSCRPARISWLQWRPGHRQIIFAVSDASHAQALWSWDLDSGRTNIIARTRGLVAGGRNGEHPCAVAKREVICVTAGPGAPPRLEAFAIGTGKRRTLFDPNANIRAQSWPVIEPLEWRDEQGRTFNGIMFLPKGAYSKRHPLFLNYYRCEGFVRGGVGDEWPFVALAEAGIASACINALPVEGPQDAVEQYRAALSGIEALIARLTSRKLIDPARIGIGGLSFGSEVAMWAVMHSDLIAAASVASPQLEPSAYWFNAVRGRDYREILRNVWGLGAPDETPERWKLVSPALNAPRIRAPLLMQLSEQEARYAIELRARLTRSQTPFEMHAFPDEPHLKVQPRHRLAAYRRNLDWFRFWLMSLEDPDPAKVEQYRRWRELRARNKSQPVQQPSQSSSEARSKTRK